MNVPILLKSVLFLIMITYICGSNAMNQDSVLKITEETLLLNDKNENNIYKEKIDRNLLDIKEITQLQIKLGNPSAPIDIYLFLRGIINDDIYSLQSLLFQNETQELPIYISKFINYSIAKKLAFALKENRIAIKTKIIVKKPNEKNNCDLYVNGNLLKNSDSFFTPAGIPIYVAIYCKDNTFEVQKVRPGESQEIYQLTFNHFLERQNIPISIPNPDSMKEINYIPVKKINETKNDRNILNSLVNDNNSKIDKIGIQFGSGIGFLKDFGTLSNENVRNMKLPKGSLIYSSSYFNYKYFLVSFDYSPMILKEKQLIIFKETGANSETKIDGYVNGNGHFFRPSIGARLSIYQFSENIKLESDLLANISFIKGEYSSSYKMGYGLQGLIGPSFELGSGFKFDFKLGMGYTFGNINGFQMGSQMQLGYSF